jgi:hypothetical protein
MSGEVSVQPGGVNDWIAAGLNRPLTSSDRIWTDKNSKAELNVGGAFLRLNSETSATLINVSDNTVQLQLDQGVLELTVNYLAPGQIYEVDTPNLAFTVMKTGVYRLNVYPSEDQTWVTVRKGQGEVTGRGNAVKIKSGQQVRFSGGTSLAHTSEPAPAPDGFDDWASVRDQRLDNSESARYVSPGVIGYQDLDAYGSWRAVAPYGPVWVPYSVPTGWAPYRFGHWAWIGPWGWTWVDDAAWGFAPFHYGRWVYTGGYWGWAPGPYRHWRSCYAPALVGWVGGPGWNVGVGFGFGGPGWEAGVNFGWFPLGWGEPYYPWYHGRRGAGLSPTYIRNVNVTNTYVTNVTNVTRNYYNNSFNNTRYVNRTVNGAVTAAPASVITGGRPINRYGSTVANSQLVHAPMVRGIQATPTREAMLGGEAPRTYGVPPARGMVRNNLTVTGGATRPASPGTPGSAAPGRSIGNGFAGNSAGSVSLPTQPARGFAGAMTPNAGSSAAPNVPRPPRSNPDNASVGRNAAAPAWNGRTRTVPSPPAPSVSNNAPAAAPSPAVPAIHRPPASYSYHPAPAYAPGSSSYHGNSFTGGHSDGKTYSAPARGYQAAPNNGGRSYSAAPSYHGATPFVGGGSPGNSAPRSVPATPHYSAPGGGGAGGMVHVAPPSGGTAVHAAPSGGSGGSGSHASYAGGGGYRSR